MKLTSKPSWPWGCRMMQKGRGLRSAATREDVYQRHAKTIWKHKKTQQFSNNFIEIDQKTHVFQHFWNSAEHWKTARAFLFAFRCGRPSKKAAAWNVNGRLNFEKSWNRKRNHNFQPKTQENSMFFNTFWMPFACELGCHGQACIAWALERYKNTCFSILFERKAIKPKLFTTFRMPCARQLPPDRGADIGACRLLGWPLSLHAFGVPFFARVSLRRYDKQKREFGAGSPKRPYKT